MSYYALLVVLLFIVVIILDERAAILLAAALLAYIAYSERMDLPGYLPVFSDEKTAAVSNVKNSQQFNPSTKNPRELDAQAGAAYIRNSLASLDPMTQQHAAGGHVPVRAADLDERMSSKQTQRGDLNKRALDGAVRNTVRTRFDRFFEDELREADSYPWWSSDAGELQAQGFVMPDAMK